MEVVNMDTPRAVDEKLSHLRSYVPFLERMIGKLEVRAQQMGSSKGQLERLHGLHNFLTKPLPKAPRMEMLEKMEAVIRSIQEKVQKAQGKPSGDITSHPSPQPSPKPDAGHHHRTTVTHGGDPRLGSNSGDKGMGQLSQSGGLSSSSPSMSHSRDRLPRKELCDKEREAGHSSSSDRGKDSVYDKHKAREYDRSGESKHGDSSRSRDRDRERSREKEQHEKNRIKELERRRSSDTSSSRSREQPDKPVDRDWRPKHPNDREFERYRDKPSSINSQDKLSDSRGRERDYHRTSDRNTSEHDRRPADSGRGGYTNHEGKASSKRNSLLDLPMPPSSVEDDTRGNASQKNKERFQSSREKLQRLFGITGSSNTEDRDREKEREREKGKERERMRERERESQGGGIQNRAWRADVRARGSDLFNKNIGDRDNQPPVPAPPPPHLRHRHLHHDGTPQYPPQPHQGYPHGRNSMPGHPPHPGMRHHQDPRQQQQQPPPVHMPVTDTPISPDQSPVSMMDVMDTPESPDADAAFSPTVSSEESSPVKKIPLEKNLPQEKGVDLEAIKKALANIRATESQKEQTTSYRYEDFVGPPAVDEDEPYDPEEVWNSQTQAVKNKLNPPSTGPSANVDVDLRNVPLPTSLPRQSPSQQQQQQFPKGRGASQPPHVSSTSSVTQPQSSTHSRLGGVNRLGKGSIDIDMRRQHIPPVPRLPQPPVVKPPIHPSPETPEALLRPPRPSYPPPPPPAPPQQPPPLPKSPPPTSSKGDSVRSRIAHHAGELIRPGQKGVAASQMERYKIKKQGGSLPDAKIPTQNKVDSINKTKEPVSVLDILLPEEKTGKAKDDSHVSVPPPRDPRLKSDTNVTPPNRDPRFSAPGGPPAGPPASRDPRQQRNMDPRKDGTSFGGLSKEVRDEGPKFCNPPAFSSREPLGNFGQVRDPRSNWEPRKETGIIPRKETGIIPRDPRMAARADRQGGGGMWPQPPHQQQKPQQQPQPPSVPVVPRPTTNYPVQTHTPVRVDTQPAQSASGSLIGQSFTCLMVRGLPPFTNSNHIYGFFQEYMLRDMCIELDQRYQCKGTAYVHFPGHASAREALELLNGCRFVGTPIELRICAVGVLRQAKIAYDQMNRDREANLGIQERPRGNCNPFYKPRPRDPPPSKPVSKPLLPNPVSKPVEPVTVPSENVPASAGPYTELCGVKLQAKSPKGSLSFKIPKIRKDTSTDKESSKSENRISDVHDKTPSKSSNNKDTSSSDQVASRKDSKTSTKSIDRKMSNDASVSRRESSNKDDTSRRRTDKPSKDSSDSDDEVVDVKKSKTKARKFKKIIITSDSDSEEEETKKPTSTTTIGKKKSDVSHAVTTAASSITHDDDDDYSSDDDKSMVIDESATSDANETEESEASSQMSEEPSEHQLTDRVNRSQKTKKGKGGVGKGRQSTKTPTKGRKKAKQASSDSTTARKPRSKKSVDKYMMDASFKPDLHLHQSSMGLKLTRHTQGELEELIKERNKLKVLSPVPQKLMITICQVDKGRRRGPGRAKAANKPPPPSDNILIIGPKKIKEPPRPPTPEEVVENEVLSDVVGEEEVNCPLIQPLEGYWEYNSKVGVFKESYLPENTGLIKCLKKEVSLNSPTSRRGKKRKISTSTLPSKKSRVSVGNNDSSGVTSKRSLGSPVDKSDNKRLKMEDENRGKETRQQFNLFDDSSSDSDGLPDLTNISPSLFDVDLTISNALPDANVLAKVLSPPHVSLQIQEHTHKPTGDAWTTPSQSQDAKTGITQELDKEAANTTTLDDVIDMVTNSTDEKIKVTMFQADRLDKDNNTSPDKPIDISGKKDDGKDVSTGKEDKQTPTATSDAETCVSVSKDVSEVSTASTQKLQEKSKDVKLKNLDEKQESDKKEEEEVKEECHDEPNLKQRKKSDETSKMNEEEPKTEERCSKNDKFDVLAAKRSEPTLTIALERLPCDVLAISDDEVSVGKVSTSSFLEDTSVVSSDSRDLKTPECQVSKKGKRGKLGATATPVECRRVTRGSIVQPLTAEQVEWDDGGVADLFQCDQCDYVGRHIASHLVNYHSERELPCEFKKEDFTPVIKDNMGPQRDDNTSDSSKSPLDLSWIPKSLNFEESVTCKKCDYISNSRFDLVYHFLEHVPEAASQVHHCRLCNFMSEFKEEFYNHMSSHTGEYRYKCNLCGHQAYKHSLIQAHHRDCHSTQAESITTSPMIQEDDWLYIHVCKTCMFVRIGMEAAEKHVKQKHAGKADIHKANMSRHIVLHSELRKSSEASEATPVQATATRPKPKGRKKKRGNKKLPDLQVFGGEEEDCVKKEEEEAAAKLVDRISSNIHTTMSVQEAQKRMSLLNSISRKLDEEAEEKMEVEGEGIKIKKEEVKSEEKKKETGEVTDVKKEKIEKPSETKEESKLSQSESKNDVITIKSESPDEKVSSSELPKECKDVNKKPASSDSSPQESDTESTMSALFPDAFEDDLMVSGEGSLQETIRKLSAKLQEDTKKNQEAGDKQSNDRTTQPGKCNVTATTTNNQNQNKASGEQASQSKPVATVKGSQDKSDEIEVLLTKSPNIQQHQQQDEDSDSDNLIICEDGDNDKDDVGSTSFTSTQVSTGSGEQTSTNSIPQSAVQDPMQTILRETATPPSANTPTDKMPKLRIRPVHQLMSQRSTKQQSPPPPPTTTAAGTTPPPPPPQQQQQQKSLMTVFKCCVSDCYYTSTSNMALIRHIIYCHGPYKCISSGCQFVTKSRDLYAMHLIKLHSTLNFLVCPFHCKNVFRHFADLINHLTDHHADPPDVEEEQEAENDSDSPGFLRIESVSTLDPTAALQMFGEDYQAGSSDVISSSAEAHSPMKDMVTGPQDITITSPLTTPLTIKFGNTVLPATATSNPLENQVTLSLPESSEEDCNALISPSCIPTQLSASPVMHPITPVSSSPVKISVLGVSKAAQPTTSESYVSSSSSPAQPSTSQQQQHQSVFDEMGSVGVGGSGVTSREGRSPPPGFATLPRTPPTVPIQSLFQEFQTPDAFRTLTRKLAPEVFKCMHRGCIFADDDPDVFRTHLSQHPRDYRCCYCLVLMATPDYLIKHVLEEHSHCQFQCKYCLYRALTKIYMGVHLKNFHPNEEPRYIKVETIRQKHPPNPAIEQFVRPYRCTYQECQYRTVDAEAFKTHVNTHGAFVILSCDFCHKHLHVIPMIQHMREHQMNENQCPYCLHGEAEKEHLLSHLLNCHPGRPGKVLLRKQITAASINNNNDVSVAAPVAAADAAVVDAAAGTDTPKAKSSIKPTRRTSIEDTPKAASSSISLAKEKQKMPQMEGRRMSRSLSRELDSKSQSTKDPGEDSIGSSSSQQQQTGDDGSCQQAEKTGLSGHALYRCGNEGCDYSSLSQIPLREHLQVCPLAQDTTVLRCHHCGKQCRHLSTLLDHLRVHGPKRYHCGVTGCDYRATMLHYFKNHMKQIHRCTGFKQLIKDHKNRDPETQEYVVYPKDAGHLMREGHRKRKNEYGIEDIHRIPRAHVSYNDLKCYYCTFTTKVRLNIIKHIKLHEKYPDGIPQRLYVTDGISSPIPVKQPVNPVPCLERKELMFDKMMNLAGSSFEIKKKPEDTDLRSKNPIPPDEYQRLPKLVPEEKLYTCGIEGCSYLSCDDMMLKYHIRTLHADATTFPCPHCTDVQITVEKMSPHFRLHGERLYRCGWCPYISYRRNVVERHMKEKHPAKKVFDFVIREPEDPDAPKKTEEPPAEEPATLTPPVTVQDPQWQCGLCNFNSVTQQEMVNHTCLKHDIKSQYKCGYCSVRSSVRTSFDAHFAAKHPSQPFRVLCMYYRLDSEDIEPISQGDDQHTHEPLWRRNDPERIRRIRGILIDDDPETKKNWLKKTGTGKPDKGEFVCPRCGSFKTSCVATFRSHLCREANYDRYQCVECGVNNALLPTLQRHFTKIHQLPFTSDSYINLPVEEDKEAWVESIIKHQQELIKKWKEKGEKGGGGNSSATTTTNTGNTGEATAAVTSLSPTTSCRRSSAASVSSSAQGDAGEGGRVVLHESGSERGRFICDVCGSECRSAAGLKSHTTAMHQARFKCHYCPFASNSEDAVKQHSSVKHPKLQNEVLDVKQRCKVQKTEEEILDEALDEIDSTSARSGKKSGLVTLSTDVDNKDEVKGEGLDEKDICEEECTSELVKTYNCQFCPFTSTTSSALNTHKRSKHPDTRLFMCLYCSGRFNTKYDALRHHRWKHHDMKPDISYMQKTEGEQIMSQSESSPTDMEGSEGNTSNTVTPKQLPPKPSVPGKARARKSFPGALIRLGGALERNTPKDSAGSSTGKKSEPNPTYSCCHCGHKASKVTIEEHIKKQHRDLPYQVRREETEKVFTEVYTYKCIHCVVESISLAQAMDHWIQNHPLLEFKFNLVLRHSGEVSNQVVSSTTVDKDLPQKTNSADVDDGFSGFGASGGADVGVTESGASGSGVSPSTNTAAVPSSTVITSSSETPSIKPLAVLQHRRSSKDMMSPRSSTDNEEDEEIDDRLDKHETVIQSTSQAVDNDDDDVVYKCGLCKKSSPKLEDLTLHMRKIHPDRPVSVKKIPRETFEQLYRQEYECGYCGLRARHKPIHRHHKAKHPNMELKITTVAQPPRQNIYYRCDVCGHVVKNMSSIRQHLRRQHQDTDEFTFTKLALGSPMRPPIKQPFKCNYCGDVGETLQEMHTHHAFLHSHLDHSITNLMDEALSSLHSPSASHSVVVVQEATKTVTTTPASTTTYNTNNQTAHTPTHTHTTEDPTPLPPPPPKTGVPRLKNTARKSFSRAKSTDVIPESTSKENTSNTNQKDNELNNVINAPKATQSTTSPQGDNIYAFVNMGGSVPVRLTVHQLSKLFDLKPRLSIQDIYNAKIT